MSGVACSPLSDGVEEVRFRWKYASGAGQSASHRSIDRVHISRRKYVLGASQSVSRALIGNL